MQRAVHLASSSLFNHCSIYQTLSSRAVDMGYTYYTPGRNDPFMSGKCILQWQAPECLLGIQPHDD